MCAFNLQDPHIVDHGGFGESKVQRQGSEAIHAPRCVAASHGASGTSTALGEEETGLALAPPVRAEGVGSCRAGPRASLRGSPRAPGTTGGWDGLRGCAPCHLCRNLAAGSARRQPVPVAHGPGQFAGRARALTAGRPAGGVPGPSLSPGGYFHQSLFFILFFNLCLRIFFH